MHLIQYNVLFECAERILVMGTCNTNEFRKKLKLLIDGQPWIIIENDFVKPGKGQAFNRTKIKNLITGRVIERTFKSGDTVETAEVATTNMQYLYADSGSYVFMNNKSFEQVEVPKEFMADEAKWLLENMEYEISIWDGKVISVTPPMFLELTITASEPGVKGDTANNVTKKATLETGAEVDIPIFIQQGMKIKVDTRTGEYLGRV